MQLVPALARNPLVEYVRLVVPRSAISTHNLQSYQTARLEVSALDQLDLQRWLAPVVIQTGGAFYRNRLRNALLRRLVPPYIERMEAARLWKHSRDVDVVYVFWPSGRAYHPAQAPIVCTYQDTTLLDFPEILGSPATEQERRRAQGWLQNVARIVVSSQAAHERLIHHFGASLAETRLIYHNISPQISAPSTVSVDAIARLPARYLLYPANTNPHKNHDMLLIAWARFARRQEMPLVLTGEGTQVLKADWNPAHTTYWQQDRLIGLVHRLGLKEGQDFFALGYLSDAALAALTQRATALVMPSLSEGGGSYPVEEALMAGVPVICSDIPVMREHLGQRSVQIVWFDPLSVESIVAGLNELVDHYDLYKRSAMMGKSAPRPSWDDVAAQYVAVFQEAAAARSQAHPEIV